MKDAGSIMLKIRFVKLDGSKAANPLQNIPDLNSQSHLSDHCIGYARVRPVDVSVSDKIFKGTARRRTRTLNHP